MSRRLTIVRHAKSDWGDMNLSDFDRPLNARGLRDAPFMGAKLAERGDRPDLMVCSPALRARTTAELLATAMDYPRDSLVEAPTIYEAPVSALLEVAQKTPEDVNHLMMVGHNPGSEQFVRFLTGKMPGDFVTCAVADLDIEVDTWKAVGPGVATMQSFWYPKMFG